MPQRSSNVQQMTNNSSELKTVCHVAKQCSRGEGETWIGHGNNMIGLYIHTPICLLSIIYTVER